MTERSLTIPSSVMEVDSGGDGVDDRKEDAPELLRSSPLSGEWRLPLRPWRNCILGEWGEHESFMRSMAAEHSERTSSSSGMCSLVRRLRLLRN